MRRAVRFPHGPLHRVSQPRRGRLSDPRRRALTRTAPPRRAASSNKSVPVHHRGAAAVRHIALDASRSAGVTSPYPCGTPPPGPKLYTRPPQTLPSGNAGTCRRHTIRATSATNTAAPAITREPQGRRLTIHPTSALPITGMLSTPLPEGASSEHRGQPPRRCAGPPMRPQLPRFALELADERAGPKSRSSGTRGRPISAVAATPSESRRVSAGRPGDAAGTSLDSA